MRVVGVAGFLLYRKRQNALRSGDERPVFGLVQMQGKGYSNMEDEDLVL